MAYTLKTLPLDLPEAPLDIPTKLVIPPSALTHDKELQTKIVGAVVPPDPNFTTEHNPHFVYGIHPKAKSKLTAWEAAHTAQTNDYIVFDSIGIGTNPCAEVNTGNYTFKVDKAHTTGDGKLEWLMDYVDKPTIKAKSEVKPATIVGTAKQGPPYHAAIGPDGSVPQPKAGKTKKNCTSCKHIYWMEAEQKQCTLCQTIGMADDYKKVCDSCGEKFNTLHTHGLISQVCSKCLNDTSKYLNCVWCGSKFPAADADSNGYCKGCHELLKPKPCQQCGADIPAFTGGKICKKCKMESEAEANAKHVAETLKKESENYAKEGEAYLGYKPKVKKKTKHCLYCDSSYYVNEHGYCEDCWESPDVVKTKPCEGCGFHFNSTHLQDGLCSKCFNPQPDPAPAKPLKVKVKVVKAPLMFKEGFHFHVVVKGKVSNCGVAMVKDTVLSKTDISTVKAAMLDFVCPKCKDGLAHV